MSIDTRIKLQPFRVPNFVLVEALPGKRQDGFHEGPKYKLSELDAATLDLLCVQFREVIFKKAGISDPSEPTD